MTTRIVHVRVPVEDELDVLELNTLVIEQDEPATTVTAPAGNVKVAEPDPVSVTVRSPEIRHG